MKKLLMMTTAIAGVAMLSAPASAAIDLDLGGYFRGYVVDVNDDAANLQSTEFRRAAEIHVDGETTLDNGLTVGAHVEFDIDENGAETDAVTADEVYAYMSGGWGRVNLGKEDGAAYLLQVAAPAADSNVDGMDITIQAFQAASLEYAMQDFSDAERVTYMTPKYNGFQAGVSYGFTNQVAANVAVMDADNTTLDTATATEGAYEDLMDVAVRYDGEYQGFAFGLGAGYSTSDLEAEEVVAAGDDADVDFVTDGIDTYNVGANVMFQNFSLGASYKVSEQTTAFDVDSAVAVDTLVNRDEETTTYVIGAAYDNGPYHVGVSYLKEKEEVAAINDAAAGVTDRSFDGYEDTTDRFTIGGGYSFGPGITFRGTVSWGDIEHTLLDATAGDVEVNGTASSKEDYTQIAIGTDVKF